MQNRLFPVPGELPSKRSLSGWRLAFTKPDLYRWQWQAGAAKAKPDKSKHLSFWRRRDIIWFPIHQDEIQYDPVWFLLIFIVQHVIKELGKKPCCSCKLSKADGFVKHVLHFRCPKSSGNCESKGVRCGKVAGQSLANVENIDCT